MEMGNNAPTYKIVVNIKDRIYAPDSVWHVIGPQ